MRTLFTCCAVAWLLAGCALPPPGAYVGANPGSAEGGRPVALGNDASGESCNQLQSDVANAVDVYCGNWQLSAITTLASGQSAPVSIEITLW